MATTIKLKNGSGAPAASDLVQGEPALDLTNKRLYSENSSGTVVEIGSTPSALSIAGTAVTSTAAELNILDGVTSFLDEDNMASNSATSIPSQQSVKAYVLAQTGTSPGSEFTSPIINAGAQLKNGATSAGYLEFFEDSDNGTNKVTLIGPASTADITLTLPSSDGDSGQFLQTNGSGVMSWEDSTGMSTSKAFYMGQL